MRPTNRNYFFVLTQRYHALITGCDKHPWLLDSQPTLRTLFIHSALSNLPPLVEPTVSAKLLEDLMFCLQSTGSTAGKSGKFYPSTTLQILGTKQRTINTKQTDREHLEMNLNTQTQLIPYLYLKYLSQMNARGICALLQCACEAASLFWTVLS